MTTPTMDDLSRAEYPAMLVSISYAYQWQLRELYDKC